MTPWNIQPVVRYEQMNTNLKVDTDNLTYNIMSFGVNYFFNDRIRLQANYRYKAEAPTEKPNDDFMLQLQMKF